MSKAIEKANRCKKLLEDPDLQQAFQDVRDALFQAFAQIPPSDTDNLIDCRKRLHLLDSVEENLYQAIRDGKLEEFRLDEQKRPPFLGDINKWRNKSKH